MTTTTRTGRPMPPHGTMEEARIDYRLARQRVPTPIDDATRSALEAADRLSDYAAVVSERDAAAVALLAGRDGLRSDQFRRRVALANRGRLIVLPSPDHDPDPDPTEIAA